MGGEGARGALAVDQQRSLPTINNVRGSQGETHIDSTDTRDILSWGISVYMAYTVEHL